MHDWTPDAFRPGGMGSVALMHALRPALALIVLLLAAGCGGGEDPPAQPDRSGRAAGSDADPGSGGAPPRRAPSVRLLEVGRFDKPIHAVPVPRTDLVAVAEQGGRLLVVRGMVCANPNACPRRPVAEGTAVVDLRGKVSTDAEQGLLGVAFHPKWPDDPRLFLNYTDPDGDTRIEAWTMATPTTPARRQAELMKIEQPFPNHNGGHLAFGPDGLLYVGTGDGGAAGDPGDRAQDPEDLLGKLLRLDVDTGGARGYAPAPANMEGGAAEVWAIGLRNPWRFSFDSERGDLWIGDVGQDRFEEVDVVPRALLEAEPPNFGWRLREGFDRFEDDGRTGPGRKVDPVLDYDRDDGCSITGGVVYRGRLVSKLRGWYLFGDFCGDDLRLLDARGVPGRDTDRGDLTWSSGPKVPQLASVAEVQRGEVLALSLDGNVHQVLPA